MNEQTAGIGATVKITLVKWDGEPPADADPMGHPQCIEILEVEDGATPTVIYRRQQ